MAAAYTLTGGLAMRFLRACTRAGAGPQAPVRGTPQFDCFTSFLQKTHCGAFRANFTKNKQKQYIKRNFLSWHTACSACEQRHIGARHDHHPSGCRPARRRPHRHCRRGRHPADPRPERPWRPDHPCGHGHVPVQFHLYRAPGDLAVLQARQHPLGHHHPRLHRGPCGRLPRGPGQRHRAGLDPQPHPGVHHHLRGHLCPVPGQGRHHHLPPR